MQLRPTLRTNSGANSGTYSLPPATGTNKKGFGDGVSVFLKNVVELDYALVMAIDAIYLADARQATKRRGPEILEQNIDKWMTNAG